MVEMQGIQSISFRPKREKLGHKITVKTVNLIIILVLITGCLWQIISIFDLYLRYPTNIFIETKFKSYYNSLPALTFCSNIGDHSGQSTDDIFGKNYSNKIIQDVFILSADQSSVISHRDGHLYDNISETVIESVGKKYYCLTFNSIIKCKLFVLIIIIINTSC